MKQALLIILGSALVTGAALRAAPALSQDISTSIVRTADLDLASAEGRKALNHRLSIAARDVCGVASDADLEGKNDVRRCRADVLARAHAERDQILAGRIDGAVIAMSKPR